MSAVLKQAIEDTHSLTILRSAPCASGVRAIESWQITRHKAQPRALLALRRAIRWAGGTYPLAVVLNVPRGTLEGWHAGRWRMDATARSLVLLFERVMELDRLPPRRKPRRRVIPSPCGPAPPTGCGSDAPETPDDATSAQDAVQEAFARGSTEYKDRCATLFPGHPRGVESPTLLLDALKRVAKRQSQRRARQANIAIARAVRFRRWLERRGGSTAVWTDLAKSDEAPLDWQI